MVVATNKKALRFGKASEYIVRSYTNVQALPGQRGFLIRFVCFIVIITLRKYYVHTVLPKLFSLNTNNS